MKTFVGWREAGRAMRWARQAGLFRDRTSMPSYMGRGEEATSVDHRWRNDLGSEVMVSHNSMLITVDVSICVEGNQWETIYNDDTPQILRVLAALDLIPAELAKAGRDMGDLPPCPRCHIVGHAPWCLGGGIVPAAS